MTRLKELRKEKGLLQKDVAEKFEVATSTYSYWEQGKFEPDSETLKKLADFFGVSVDYLLGNDETKTPSLHIPDAYKSLPVAFSEGLKGLTQEDIDDVIRFMEFLKNKK